MELFHNMWVYSFRTPKEVYCSLYWTKLFVVLVTVNVVLLMIVVSQFDGFHNATVLLYHATKDALTHDILMELPSMNGWRNRLRTGSPPVSLAQKALAYSPPPQSGKFCQVRFAATTGCGSFAR